jgi:hypothetical protein
VNFYDHDQSKTIFPINLVDYLSMKHGTWRYLHVVAELEVREKIDSLKHTGITIRLETDVCNRSAWVDVPNHVLRYNIESRCLPHQFRQEIFLESQVSNFFFRKFPCQD